MRFFASIIPTMFVTDWFWFQEKGFDLNNSFGCDNEEFFKINGLLFSTYHILDLFNKNKKGYIPPDELWDKVKFSKKVPKMFDSGGFQINTLNAKITPEQVMEIYKKTDADYGFVLDAGNNIINKKNIKFATENTKRMIDYYKSNDIKTKIFNVYHGYDYNSFNKYADEVEQFNDTFNNVSLGVKPPSNGYAQLFFFMLLVRRGIITKDTIVHFLGISGTNIIPLFLLCEEYCKTVFFDSAANSMAAAMTRMFLPFGNGVGLTKIRVGREGLPSNLKKRPKGLGNSYITRFFGNDTMNDTRLIRYHNIEVFFKMVENWSKFYYEDFDFLINDNSSNILSKKIKEYYMFWINLKRSKDLYKFYIMNEQKIVSKVGEDLKLNSTNQSFDNFFKGEN